MENVGLHARPVDGAINQHADVVVDIHSTNKKGVDAMRGLAITFKDLTYTVKHRKTKKDLNILSGVSGFFKPGHMAALMGPSGSGKTTLLDVLAGRKTVGSIQGEILFGAEKPGKAFLKKHTGYVEQFDTLLDMLTVAEMLMYTAELKLPETMTVEEKRARVDDMVSLLHLKSCRDTRIGSNLARGVSGGQAKRVNIGISLITDPAVLFLDEPTSGLDSHTATEVMDAVKGLTADNRTICATIHSPTAYTFNQFDTLVLLLDGRLAYFGPNGTPAINHFTSCRLAAHAFSAQDTEAEWIMDLATSAAGSDRAIQFADAYAKSDLARSNVQQLEQLKEEAAEHAVVKEMGKRCMGGSKSQYGNGTNVGFLKAASTLFKYRTLRAFRDKQFMGARLGEKIIVVAILVTLFAGRGDKRDSRGTMNMAGMLFLWATLASFGAAQYVPSLVMERALFYRESADGLYTVATYLFTKMSEEMLLAFVSTGVLSVPVYYIIGIKGSLMVLWMVYFVTLCCGIAAAFFFAAAAPTVDIANAALPAYMVSLLYFSGLVMNFKSIPSYWVWYSKINFVRYGFTALLVNHFKEDVLLFGQPVLHFFSVQGESAWENIAYQCLFFGVFTTMAYLALRYVRHDKR